MSRVYNDCAICFLKNVNTCTRMQTCGHVLKNIFFSLIILKVIGSNLIIFFLKKMYLWKVDFLCDITLFFLRKVENCIKFHLMFFEKFVSQAMSSVDYEVRHVSQ